MLLVAAFIGSAIATDASSFCPTCHEMRPYYAAWEDGTHGHEGVDCIDCHVNPGMAARLEHKPVALLEVWAHFFGNTSFPLPTSPTVPNARCTRCHPTVKVTRKNFSHELHAAKGTCEDCHPTTGHAVSAQALKDAGIFNPNVVTRPLALKVAAVNGGKANLNGHVNVVCSRCHDMKATGCRACHKPPHEERGDCAQCHRPGATFVFTHPSGGDCASCHKVPGDHPAAAIGKQCALCHVAGKSWGFSHPKAGATCVNCHKVPGKHPSAAAGKACTTCHASGKSWSFSHPASGSNCTGCHARPAGHYAGACFSCHKNPGASWAFSHPSAGEHSWRSIACAKCHPNGNATYYCTCHNGQPPNDD